MEIELIESLLEDFDSTDTKTTQLSCLKDIIKECLDSAKQVVSGTHVEERAKAYWIAQIEMALSENHGYLGSAGCSMEQTINELSEEELE